MSATIAYDDVASARARRSALRVVMVGPGLNVRGGISNGQRLLIDALPKEVSVEHVASMVEGSKWRKLLTFFHALREIRKRVRGGEIVHIHFASGASSRRKMIIARLALRRGGRVIMHARGGGYREYWQGMSRAEQRFTLETLLSIQCLVVLGEGWRRFYESIGVPSNRIVMAPNPVRIPDTPPQRTDNSIVRFAYLGLIIERKGTFDLVQAIAKLPAQVRSRVKFVIAGNGAIDELRRRSEQLGVADAIEIREWITPAQRDELLASVAGFVLPSYVEGLPNALLEAMAWSLPCICTPVGSVPEFARDNVNALIVQPGAVEDLAAAIERLVLDPALRERLGAAARATVEPLDVRLYARTMCDLYKSVARRAVA